MKRAILNFVLLAMLAVVTVPALAQSGKFSTSGQRIVAVSADYTVPVGVDVVLVTASSAAITVTLYDPNRRYANGSRDEGSVRVHKADATTYPITVAAAAGSVVGNTVLRQQYQSAEFISDGVASWYNFDPVPDVYTATVSLTSAQIRATRATPITLVQAQGAGTIIEFVGATLILDYATSGATESSDNFAIKYVDGSGIAVSETIENTGFIDQTADTVTFAVPDGGAATAIATKAQCENVALVLHNTGDGEIGGTGTSVLRVKITWRVHSSGL
jgi:hypothetical protein